MANKELTTQRRQLPARSDIYEDKGNVIVEVEMPGVTKENLEVKIENDMLIIRGRKNTVHDEKTSFLIKEISDGDYYQEYALDNTIDRNRVDAALRNGILTITLCLKESEKPRKIQVTTA